MLNNVTDDEENSGSLENISSNEIMVINVTKDEEDS